MEWFSLNIQTNSSTTTATCHSVTLVVVVMCILEISTGLREILQLTMPRKGGLLLVKAPSYSGNTIKN